MQSEKRKKSDSKPTVVYSGKPCVFCDDAKSTDTVLLNYGKTGFRSPVCMGHLLALLKKWRRTKDQAADGMTPKEVPGGRPV